MSARITTRAGRKVAQITACTVEVACPHCGEGQPNPDNGAFSWTPAEVSAAQGPRRCVGCDEEFRIVAQSKVPCEVAS